MWRRQVLRNREPVTPGQASSGPTVHPWPLSKDPKEKCPANGRVENHLSCAHTSECVYLVLWASDLNFLWIQGGEKPAAG